MKKYLLVFSFIGLLQPVKAQFVQDYFFKSWDLTYINAAGITQPGGLKGNIQYNRDLIGSVNTSTVGQVQLHSNIGTRHGVGLTLQNYHSGILYGSGVGAGYGHRLQLGQEHYLALGSRFNYFKYNLNRADVVNANVSDPVLYGDIYAQNSMLISTGVLYEWRQLQVGASAPEFLPMGNFRYNKRNLNLFLGYTFDMDTWSLRPNFYYENLAVVGDWYEMSIQASYQKAATLEISYTSESAYRVKAGINLRSFELGYGYDAGNFAQSEDINKMGHRIYLGYNFGDVFGKMKERKEQERQDREQIDIILKENTRLIEDYRKELQEVEESQRKNSEQKAVSSEQVPGEVVPTTPNPSVAVKERPTQPIVAKPNAPKSGPEGYYIAVGSFATMKSASVFLKKLESAGYTPKVLFNSDLKMYRVFVQKDETLEESQASLAKIRKAGYKNAWIFRIK